MPSGAMQMTRVAVVGAGNWGKNLVRNFYQIPSCELISCVDPSPERQEFIRQMFPGVKVIGQPDEVFQDDLIDAVVISSPTPTHYPLAKAALEAGKHVLVEKPMTQRIEEAEELIALASRAQLTLMVGHLMLYHPAVQRLKEFLLNGELGELYYLYSQRVNLGTIRSDENALWNFAPHDISTALYLFGTDPQTVVTVGESYLQPGIEDVVFLNIKFDNQCMAQIHLSWLDPHKIRRMTVVGSRKMAVFDDMESVEKVRLYDKGVEQVSYRNYGEALSLRFGDILIPRIPMAEPLRIECEHFLECVEQEKNPISDGYEGLRVLRVLEAAQQSMEQGGVSVEL
jgi:predicted dehydrogenase